METVTVYACEIKDPFRKNAWFRLRESKDLPEIERFYNEYSAEFTHSKFQIVEFKAHEVRL